MAVEIPVVIDIEGAFKDAAKRVPAAVQPLRTSLEHLTEDLGVWREIMNESDIDSSDFREAAKNVQAISQAIEVANDKFIKFSTNEGSIKRMSAELASLNRRWEEMGAAQKFRSDGTLTDEAKQLYGEYKKITAELQKSGKSLAQMEAEEKKVISAAIERYNLIHKNQRKVAQTRQYENTILNTTVKTMRVLQEQERILSDRLSRTQIGTQKYADLAAKIKAVRQEMNMAKGSVNGVTGALRSQSIVLSNLTSMASMYFSLFGALRFAKQIRDVTGELEYQRVALGHLIQDEEYGARLFEKIKAAAVESPFRIKDLVTYTKQLAAYRVETTQLFDTTKRLADVSAGLGVDMNRLILAYGQVRAASVLRGQELRQFTEAGIPLVELLAEKFTELKGTMVSTADVFELISKRAVPFSMIQEIFQDLTDVGGAFYQMQETQAKTLQGRWEKLKDTFDIALQAIGDSKTFRFENDLLIGTLQILAKNLKVIPKLLAGATVAWGVYRVATMRARIEEARSARMKIQLTAQETAQIASKHRLTVMTNLHTKAVIAERAATNALSKSFWKLTAAMLANPVTAILAGVAALTTAFLTFREKTDKATESAEKLAEWTDTIERQGNVIGQNKRMDTLINRYDRLANKTQLTAKEQQSLSQTMRVLQGQFQDVTIEIGNANNPISVQVAELRKLNKRQKEAAISTLQLTKAQIEQRLSELALQEQEQTAEWLSASREKRRLEDKKKEEKLRGKERRALKKAIKNFDEYGEALNKTSGEINTLQNRLVSIDNILNPKTDTPTERRAEGLRQLRDAINDITSAYKKFVELREYESKSKALKDIATLFPSLGGWEPTYENMVSKLGEMLQRYEGNADATRIIEQALANIKFDRLKEAMDEALKKLTEQMKQSETARKFYESILGATGDENLAQNLTISVYGNVGRDFAERIQEELYRALKEIDPENVPADVMDRLMGDITILDIDDMTENLSKLPPKVRTIFEKAIEAVRKHNAELAKEFADMSAKYGDVTQKIKQATDKTNNQIERIEKARDKALLNPKLTAEEKANIESQAASIIAALRGDLELQLKKLSDDYIKFFAEINVMTAEQATTVRSDLRDAYLKAFHDGAITADELYKNLRTIDTQFKKLNEHSNLLTAYLEGGFEKANDKLLEYSSTITVLAAKLQKGENLDVGEQAFADRMLKRFGSSSEQTKGIQSYTQLIEAFKDKGGLQAAGQAFGQMGKGMASMAANGPGALAIVDAIFKAVHATISGIQQIIDQVNELRSEENKIGGWFKYLSDFDKYTFSGWEKLKSGDAIGATVDAISSWISIFNNVQRDLIDKYNDQIKEQSKLLEDLEYSYSRLGVAIEKAFGSDYIQAFNQQMQILEAEAEAYQKQADAERRKGKSADSDAIRQYERSAQEVRDRIADANSQLSEYFAGTDLTSAARDFAESWIEAYKEFGSTTDALSQKFEDMIQNMIVNSMAARVVQEQLKPIFDMIDTLASDDGQLSIMDAAMIANKTKETVGTLNTGLTNLMNALGGAGINLRQMGTGLTGIARDIQGASEESILGLAAGVNTQNYYMQHIDINVQAILAALTGTAQTGTPATGAVVSNPYQEQMLAYVGSLPQMQGDLAAIRTMLNNVIKVKGTPATHYVATQ